MTRIVEDPERLATMHAQLKGVASHGASRRIAGLIAERAESGSQLRIRPARRLMIAVDVPPDVVAEASRAAARYPPSPRSWGSKSIVRARWCRTSAGAGYEVTTGIGVTGVVGVLRGTRPGKTIMLRADMDALPIDEEQPSAYASTTPGVMHACGHDGHVAILLGAARLIVERRAELAGTLVLCFQPAEEGKGGAQAMVEAGVLERFGVARPYGLPLASAHPTGIVGLRAGPFYASSDSIEITIEGKGGHGAAPHLSVDPIFVAGLFLVALQQVVRGRSIRSNPHRHDRCDHAGTTHNDPLARTCSAPCARSTRVRSDGGSHRARAARRVRVRRVTATTTCGAIR